MAEFTNCLLAEQPWSILCVCAGKRTSYIQTQLSFFSFFLKPPKYFLGFSKENFQHPIHVLTTREIPQELHWNYPWSPHLWKLNKRLAVMVTLRFRRSSWMKAKECRTILSLRGQIWSYDLFVNCAQGVISTNAMNRVNPGCFASLYDPTHSTNAANPSEHQCTCDAPAKMDFAFILVDKHFFASMSLPNTFTPREIWEKSFGCSWCFTLELQYKNYLLKQQKACALLLPVSGT